MPPAGVLTGAPAALVADPDVIYVNTFDGTDPAPGKTINVGASHMQVIPPPFEFPVENMLRVTYEALSGNSQSGCDVRATFSELGIAGGPYSHLFSHFFVAFYDDFVFSSTPGNTASSGGISNPRDGGGGSNSHSIKLPGGFAGMENAASRSFPGGGAADPACQVQTEDGWSVRNFLDELSGSETQVRPALYSYLGENLSGNTCSSGGAGTSVKTTSLLFQRGLRLYFCAIEVLLNTSTGTANGEQHLYVSDVTADGFGQVPDLILSRTGLRYRTASCPNAYISGLWDCSFPGGKYTFPGSHLFGLQFVATSLKASPAPGTPGTPGSGLWVGSDAAPGSTGGLSPNRERLSLFTVPQTGTLAVARARLAGNPSGAGAQDVRVVVRENVVTTAPEGGGEQRRPGDVIDFSADYEVAAADASAEVEVGAMDSGAAVTDGDRVWVGIGSGPGNAALYGWDFGAGEFALLPDMDFATGPVDPASTPSTLNANRIAVRVTITPESSGEIETPPGVGGPTRHNELAIAATSTWSHEVEAGDDRILLGFATYRRIAASMASMVFNGSEALALAIAANQSSVCRSEIWSRVAPTVTTANIVATNQGDQEDVVTGSLSFSGVDQADPFRDEDSSGGLAPSVTLDTQAGDLIVACVGSQNEITMAAGGGGDHEIESFTGDGDAGMLVFTLPGAEGTTTVTVTGDGASSMILTAVVLKPAVAADTTPPANVTDLALTEPTPGTIRATFTASVSLDTEAYLVRYKAGASQTFADETDGTQFTAETACTPGEAIVDDLAGFDDDSSFTVAVFCKDEAGNWNSANGATATIRTADTTAPAAPSALVLTETTPGTIRASVTMPADFDAVAYVGRWKAGEDETFSGPTDGSSFAAQTEAEPLEEVTVDVAGFTAGSAYTVGWFAVDLSGNVSAAAVEDITLAEPTEFVETVDVALAALADELIAKTAVLVGAQATGDRAALDLAATEVQFIEQARAELARAKALWEGLP